MTSDKLFDAGPLSLGDSSIIITASLTIESATGASTQCSGSLCNGARFGGHEQRCLCRCGAVDAVPGPPPYYVTNTDGSVGGLVAGPVREAFDDAGISVAWKIRPGKRQIETIRQNRTAVCSPGWFKKPEREAFAKFSNVVYQDLPQVVIIRTKDLGVFDHPTLATLFADTDHSFGIKLGYSHGGFIDDLIAKHTPRVQRTSKDVQRMVRMLMSQRFDYMLVAEEEFESLQTNLTDVADTISALQMPDIPPGNKRYLMCSKKVSDAVIQRFNAALAAP